jgi:putative Mn2+ efflux pump MntP
MTNPRPRVTPEPSLALRRELKGYLLKLVASVVVLDAVAIGLYYGFHIADRPLNTQEVFIAVWVVVTLIIVTTMMKRIRQARRRG